MVHKASYSAPRCHYDCVTVETYGRQGWEDLEITQPN
jgi:hypothetical protein